MTGAAAHARILVAIAEAEECNARLEIAAAVAKGLRLELTAVLVEQQALFDLMALPIAREVRSLGGEIRPLESAVVAGAARRREQRMRQRLQDLSGSAGVSWSLTHLRISSGFAEIESLRRSGDILALSPSLAGEAASGPLLITPAAGPAHLGPGPIAWVTDSGEEAPETAVRIATALDRRLITLTPSQVRVGRYGSSSASPCMLVAARLKAPLDSPRGLLLLARETSRPVLLLGEGSDGPA